MVMAVLLDKEVIEEEEGVEEDLEEGAVDVAVCTCGLCIFQIAV